MRLKNLSFFIFCKFLDEYPIFDKFIKKFFLSIGVIFFPLFLRRVFCESECHLPILNLAKYFHGNFSPGSCFLPGAISE